MMETYFNRPVCVFWGRALPRGREGNSEVNDQTVVSQCDAFGEGGGYRCVGAQLMADMGEPGLRDL